VGSGWGLTGGPITTTGNLSLSTANPALPCDSPVNMTLSPSVGSSALTLTVLGNNGSTPSATNPVLVCFRDTTLGSGDPVWVAITSALSITVPSGATLGVGNGVPFRVWLFGQNNAGTVVLGVALCSKVPVTYGCEFWEQALISGVGISSGSTTPGQLYTSTSTTSLEGRILGWVSFEAGLATAGAYTSLASTVTQVVSAGSPRPGHVTPLTRQQNGGAANTTNTYTPSNTAPAPANGGALYSTAVGLASASDLLHVRSQLLMSSSGASSLFSYLYNGTTTLTVSACSTPGSGTSTVCPLDLYLQPGGNSVTYSLYYTGGTGTTYVNQSGAGSTYGGVNNSYIQFDEIMGANDNTELEATG
jgi:hypothetical protein